MIVIIAVVVVVVVVVVDLNLTYIFLVFVLVLVLIVDAWARSGERGAAANRAEALLHHMNSLYQSGGHDKLKPTTGIFNAVINAWARSREKIAPVRAEQILSWMENFKDLDIQPDKYTYNTVIHAWAKAGGTEAAAKAQQLLASMERKYQEGNIMAKPDTITVRKIFDWQIVVAQKAVIGFC